MLQYLTGGAWGVVIRRTLEAASRTLPVIFILFLPIAIGADDACTNGRICPADDITLIQRGWYHDSVLLVAPIGDLFRALWRDGLLLNKWSANQDKSKDHEEAAMWLGTRNGIFGSDDGHLRAGRDVRGGRLGDDARAALVLDDLGTALRRRLGLELSVLHGHHARVSCRTRFR